MANTIIVAGYGPGISKAVAEKFGSEGFAVAAVARNPDKLAAAVAELTGKGIRAQAFPADVGDPKAVRDLVKAVRDNLGPVDVLHWNAVASGGSDLTAPDDDGLRRLYDVAIVGFAAAVQAALPDLRANRGAVLVTNGGLALLDDKVDAVGVAINAMGLAMINAAKHKAVRLLAQKLRADGVFVGEVMVTKTVKGTAFDTGTAELDARTVATKFWELYKGRRDLSLVV